MTSKHQEAPHAPQRTQPVSRSLKTALWMLAAIVGFFLLREHWNHAAGNWVYLVLLACPLMHFFHGHVGHSNHSNKNET